MGKYVGMVGEADPSFGKWEWGRNSKPFRRIWRKITAWNPETMEASAEEISHYYWLIKCCFSLIMFQGMIVHLGVGTVNVKCECG